MHTALANINNLRPLLRGRLPGQLVIQYSNRCNADCPQCGMRRSLAIERFTLDDDRAKSMIDRAAARGIRSLSLTGGEPLLFVDRIVALINHARAAGIPFVRTGTNGFLFRDAGATDFERRLNRIAEKLAATGLYTFWISLDSASPEAHERIRGLEGVVKGIERALPIFHRHGIYPAANLGINRSLGRNGPLPSLARSTPEEFFTACTQGFAQFYRQAVELGFTMANACYPMSDDGAGPETAMASADSAVYGAISSNPLVSFSGDEKALLFQALFETIPKFRGSLRIFTPRCALFGLIRRYRDRGEALFPCRGGTDFFFADCREGLIHPCGFRAEPRADIPDRSGSPGALDHCELCEWECFRDPSDLLGPFAELFSRPVSLIRKLRREPAFFKLLREDLGYYRACDFFNGRKAPRSEALRRYQQL